MTFQSASKCRSVIARGCVDAIGIDVPHLPVGQDKRPNAVAGRMSSRSHVTGFLQIFVSRISNQTVSPPILERANIIVVIISDSISNLNRQFYRNKDKPNWRYSNLD